MDFNQILELLDHFDQKWRRIFKMVSQRRRWICFEKGRCLSGQDRLGCFTACCSDRCSGFRKSPVLRLQMPLLRTLRKQETMNYLRETPLTPPRRHFLSGAFSGRSALCQSRRYRSQRGNRRVNRSHEDDRQEISGAFRLWNSWSLRRQRHHGWIHWTADAR